MRLRPSIETICGVVYDYAAAKNFSPVIGACLTVGAGEQIPMPPRLSIHSRAQPGGTSKAVDMACKHGFFYSVQYDYLTVARTG